MDIEYYDSLDGRRLRKIVAKHFDVKLMRVRMEQNLAIRKEDGAVLYAVSRKKGAIEQQALAEDKFLYADYYGRIVEKEDIESEYREVIDDKKKDFFSSQEWRTHILVTITSEIHEHYSASLWDTNVKHEELH